MDVLTHNTKEYIGAFEDYVHFIGFADNLGTEGDPQTSVQVFR
jgi:hypothetical protein